MSSVLQKLAYFIAAIGFIGGVANGFFVAEASYSSSIFSWWSAIPFWVSGIIASIFTYAFGVVLEHLQFISYNLARIEKSIVPEETTSNKVKSNSKANLSTLKGYSMKSSD